MVRCADRVSLLICSSQFLVEKHGNVDGPHSGPYGLRFDRGAINDHHTIQLISVGTVSRERPLLPAFRPRVAFLSIGTPGFQRVPK